MMRVLGTGSRARSDAEAIRQELARLPSDCTILLGDAPVADARGPGHRIRIALQRRVEVRTFPAR